MELRLLSVNVGLPRTIAVVAGEPVLSGIAKKPLNHKSVFVGATNIAGDRQADLTVHGGADKAIYAYPTTHWAWWREQGLESEAVTFGENLTLEGVDETMVAIGDRFRWGAALLEISQPRAPCYKFAIHARRADAPQLMTLSSRCGWYLRVLEEGDAPIEGGVLVREHASGGPTVRDAFRAALHRTVSKAERQVVLAAPSLAAAWQHAVARWLQQDQANAAGR